MVRRTAKEKERKEIPHRGQWRKEEEDEEVGSLERMRKADEDVMRNEKS